MTDPKLREAELKSAAAMRSLADTLTRMNTDNEPGLWAKFITVTVALGMAFPLLYLRGWVALKLWQWFAAPIWPSIHMTAYTTVGLILLLTAFRRQDDLKPDSDSSLSKAWTNLISGAIYPLALLGVAWIWTWLAWGV